MLLRISDPCDTDPMELDAADEAPEPLSVSRVRVLGTYLVCPNRW
uniref:Uncharacterized protein n=1 Tax=Rhizophora mucronata TaxID=61149 RepID=A0A2P2IQT8_RHIMU